MEKSMKCVKNLIFVFNLVFAITGLALIITGSVIQGVNLRYLDFLGNKFLNIPILLIILGCIVFGIAFLGCCGAYNENYCLVVSFAALLSLLLLMEVGVGVAAYVLRKDVETIVSSNMEKGLQNYDKQGYEGITKTWDLVQHELKCCGAKSFSEWGFTAFSVQNNGSVPDSCCVVDVQGCGKEVLIKDPRNASGKIFTRGCLESIKLLVTENAEAVGGVGGAIALIQLLGIVLSSMLAKSIRADYERV